MHNLYVKFFKNQNSDVVHLRIINFTKEKAEHVCTVDLMNKNGSWVYQIEYHHGSSVSLNSTPQELEQLLSLKKELLTTLELALPAGAQEIQPTHPVISQAS